MKQQIKILCAIALLLISSNVQSQDTAPSSPKSNNSLLWEITGNGLAKPSYLFGTYHMLCKDQFVIKDKVKQALAKTDAIVTEINFLDSAEMAAMQRMLLSKKKMSETLTGAKQQELDQALRSIGLNLKQADNFSLTLLYSLASFKAINCAPADMKNIDVELMKMAKAGAKSVAAFETISGQHSFIENAYSLDDVILQMKNAEEMKKLYAQLAAAYMSEDIVLLDKLLKHPAFMNEAQEKLMLTDRNNDWAREMPAMMKNKSRFFAVGAGHLWGKEGVINLLVQKGYTLKPVFQ